MNIPSKNELNKGTLIEKVFQKRWSEFYSFLNDNYKDCKTLSEKLFLYYNGLDKRPVCEVCGAVVGFISFFEGFNINCSQKCARKNPNKSLKAKRTFLKRYGVENPSQNKTIREKIKQTNLKRYGVEFPIQNKTIKEKTKQATLKRYGVENISQSESIKEKKKQTFLDRYGVEIPSQNKTVKEKIKQTNLERYGAECSLQNESIKEKAKQTNLKRYGNENPFGSDMIKEKIKQTNLERYGVEYVISSDTIKEKIKQTNLERYGVKNVSQNKIIKEKAKHTNKETNIESHLDLIRYDKDGNWICKCPHMGCSKCLEKEYIISQQNYYNRNKLDIEPCTKLLPIQPLYSTPELQIRNFLDSLNIEYITNDRVVITPKELDIYIPSKNIAIEFNGSYWHSNKDKYYHQNKTIACYSKGILLIHIYEHEWNKDRESILERLKKILNGEEVDGIVLVKDYDKYILSEPVLTDCGSYKIWNEGKWILKKELL